jgi:hypothetical protein
MHWLNLATLASVAILIGSGCASASTIVLDSHAGLQTSKGVTTVAITPQQPAWQPNHPVNPGDPTDTSAIWISYAETGWGDPVFVAYGGQTPVFSVYDSFVSGEGRLLLKVWADDSAGVFLDGVLIKAPLFTQSTCSGAPIGCRPQDAGVFDLPIQAGPHTLTFDVYQTGTGTNTTSNPLGLLFTGTAPEGIQPTPEPVSFLLIGSGLIATAILTRRRKPRA